MTLSTNDTVLYQIETTLAEIGSRRLGRSIEGSAERNNENRAGLNICVPSRMNERKKDVATPTATSPKQCAHGWES